MTYTLNINISFIQGARATDSKIDPVDLSLNVNGSVYVVFKMVLAL